MPEIGHLQKVDSWPTFREREDLILEELFDDVDFDFDLKGYHSDATNMFLRFAQREVIKAKIAEQYKRAMEKVKNASGASSPENLYHFLENKRKIMKEMIEKKKEMMNKKMKTPPFLRSSDKCAFTISVACLCFTEWILLMHPQQMYLWYTLLVIPLLTWRYIYYSKLKYQYFMLDFCYFVQVILIFWMHFIPHYTGLFSILFALCNGPLAVGSVVWRNSMVFHDLDKITSVFIHLFPPLITFCARWYPPNNDYSLVCQNPECTISSYEMFIIPMCFYVLWQVLYVVQTEWIDYEKLRNDKDIMTTERYWTHIKPHPILIFLRKRGVTIRPLWMLIFFQGIYTMLCFLPIIPLYNSFALHSAYMLLLILISIWNGANFYFDVFTETYAKRLRRFLEDKHASSPTTSNSAELQDASSIQSSPSPVTVHAKEN